MQKDANEVVITLKNNGFAALTMSKIFVQSFDRSKARVLILSTVNLWWRVVLLFFSPISCPGLGHVKMQR